jgi:ribosome-associated toxin RatA of RatAB toxin-antitoxin module
MSDVEEESQYEWFKICDEKNILLEKNENNLYKITFNIRNCGNEDTVLHVLKNGQLFELLSALNPDVIEKIKVSENDNIHHVFITFKNLDDKINSNQGENILNVHFYLKYKFKEGKCIITSQKKQNNSNDNISGNGNNDENNIDDSLFISHIKLKAVEKNEKTSIQLIFKLDNINTSNLINMYIGLYFKKIFHRFKQYFE